MFIIGHCIRPCPVTLGEGAITRIVVAGGAGFIGSYLSHRLRRSAIDVLVLDAFRPYAVPYHKNVRDLRAGLLDGIQVEQVDLLNEADLRASLARFQPDVIVNLAANPIVSSAEQTPESCARDIVEATENLVRVVRQTASVRRLVQVSSSMVYGNFGRAAAVESRKPAPVNNYGRLKLTAEALVLGLTETSAIAPVIIRPMAVYGPGDGYDRVVPVFCRRALAGQTLIVSTSRSTADFSFVEDVAQGLELAALRPAAAGQIFNMSHGASHSLLDVVAILGQHVAGVCHELRIADEMTRPIRGSLDISKAQRLLGFAPETGLEEGIRRCLQFMTHVQAMPHPEPEELSQ